METIRPRSEAFVRRLPSYSESVRDVVPCRTVNIAGCHDFGTRQARRCGRQLVCEDGACHVRALGALDGYQRRDGILDRPLNPALGRSPLVTRADRVY